MGKYCAQCGQKLKSDSRFCPQCGGRVEQEKSLIQRAQENDVQAWETIYQNTYARAYSVAIQIVKIREDALDILQEAYISAFKNINSLRDEAKIGAWINSIVSNRCKDWIRKKKPMLFTDMNSEEYDVEFEDVLMNDNQEFMPEESMDYEQTKAIMQEILWKLPEDQRLCVLMYYYNEMSVSAIAETLECSDGTIKSRLNYARKFIKREVEELEKKGTKLYSIAPLPFIVWMLRSNEHTIMAEAADRPLKNAIRELVKNETKEVVKSAIEKEAGQTAKETVAEEAAKAARKAGGKHIAKKIISGIVAVSLVGTGSYVASKKYHKKQETIKVTGTKDTGTKSDKKGKETNKAEKKENELRELKQKVDYDYLERLCSYFPSDTPYQDMTDDDWKRFYTTIMQTAYEDYYCPHEYGEHLDKRFRAKDVDIIPEEEFVTHDKKNGASFKKDTLDKVQQISGSKVDPRTMTDSNDYLSYTKDRYKLSGELLDTMEKCTVTGKNINYDEKAIMVDIEKSVIKTNTDEDSYTDYKMGYQYYTVVLKAANNNYGYKIAEIRNDYDTVENDPDTIVENVKEKPETVLNLAKILGTYDVENATSSTDKEQDLMKKILHNAGNASLVEEDQGYDEDDYLDGEYYKSKDGARACELAGISQDVINNFSGDDDDLEFNSIVYKIKTRSDADYYNKESFFLRAESDTKKNLVTCYCLLHDNSKENGKFERETIVLEPYWNSLGYRIKKITKQDWENDTYKDEIQNVLKDEKEVEKGFDSAIASEVAETASQHSELWKAKATLLIQDICDKYPKQKKQIEEADKNYWSSLDEKVEQVNENPFLEGNGALGAENGNTDKMQIYYQGAKARVYFLIGNVLMDKNINALYE